MKFLIIIPAHNEEQNIGFCLESLANQTFKDFKIVVVNDGSSDKTQEIINKFVTLSTDDKSADIVHEAPQFSLINLGKSQHEPGAKVVQTFNKGLETQNLCDFDVVCKFDADLIFPENYLEEINKIYESNPKAGMVSGLVYIEKNGEWIFENLSSKHHVRGPIKSYRKECFQMMNGLRPVLGWDNLDVMLAKMQGFEVITLKNIWVKHLRPTAYKYKNQKAEKLGEYFYNIGLNFPLAMVSSAKSSFKNYSFSEFFITMNSFLKQKNQRVLTKEEMAFIRKLRWSEMFKKIRF